MQGREPYDVLFVKGNTMTNNAKASGAFDMYEKCAIYSKKEPQFVLVGKHLLNAFTHASHALDSASDWDILLVTETVLVQAGTV